MKRILYVYVFSVYSRLFLKGRTFQFRGQDLKYFYHPHNHTWANERAIEIPLILHFVETLRPSHMLEIGNVLSYYQTVNWAILDKYENGENIINEDIADFNPRRKFELVLSISTLEHIGFDEEKKDGKKILKAIENIKQNCLKQRGVFVFTIPVGWNNYLDQMLLQDEIDCAEIYYFTRVNWDNTWIPSPKMKTLVTKYGDPYIGANGLVLGVIKN